MGILSRFINIIAQDEIPLTQASVTKQEKTICAARFIKRTLTLLEAQQTDADEQADVESFTTTPMGFTAAAHHVPGRW